RVAAVCRRLPPVQPLGDLRHVRILAPGMWGGEVLFGLQGFLCHALRLRGAEVLSLLCDSHLAACTARKVDHTEPACTRWCHRNAGPFARAMKLPHRWYGELITDRQRRACAAIATATPWDEIPTFTFRGVPLGEHVLRSLESYYKVARVVPYAAGVANQGRAFLQAALEMAIIGDRVLDEHGIDKVFTVDGKKVDWGVLRAVAQRRGIPVDVMQVGARGTSVRFETDRPGQPTARMPQWERWRDLPLTPEQDQALDEYLRQRATTPFDNRGEAWQVPRADPDEVRRLIGLPAEPAGRVFAMFPNLGFDAGKTSTVSAFDSAIDWILETMAFFAARPQHHLVVKAHPAERNRSARDSVLALLAQRYPTLPPNVHLIESGAGVSAHTVVRLADVALVYTSTVALEAAVLGRPVVLVGGGWNARRGFTLDVSTPAEYLEVLARLAAGEGPDPAPVALARRYAYSLFFRATIPISHVSVFDLDVASINLEGLEALAPGLDPSVDAICGSILRDEPFENPRVTPGGSALP
ncbi:MAG: capsular polysaccharide export protein, LipB/KpsS family, partial [Planctomycetota bacterium]